MKKSLFAVVMLLFVSSKQMLACDYYEDDKKVLDKILYETGAYKSNVTGKLCSRDKKIVIPIKDGKVDGLLKFYYESGRLAVKANFKNGKLDVYINYITNLAY